MVLQSVSCLISLDNSISLHAISAYIPDHACINHAGTAVLSSQEFLSSLHRLFSIFNLLFLSFCHCFVFALWLKGTDLEKTNPLY